jgi:8'-apo-carotenoid 13,14-cleaving dioxygenase
MEAGGTSVELNYELDTVARNDFYGTLPGAFSAHTKLDPRTGELHAMVYAWAQWLDHVQYVIVGVDGRVRTAVDVALPGMTMLHDLSLTERYAVIFDQPVTVDIDLAIAGRFPFRWNPEYGNRVGLVPRAAVDAGMAGIELAGQIVWVEMPLCYSFHPLNAYDADDGSVVIDLCVYDTMFHQELRGPFESPSRLERWVVNPATRHATVTVVDESPNEFPRVAEAYTSQAHRYGYTVAPALDEKAGWPTLKHDLVTGSRTVLDHGPGRCAGEAVLVPRVDAAAEDDGWLLAMVHDLGAESTDLVVMDAADLARGYVARIGLPQRVPFGFHANWVSDLEVPQR